MSLQLNEERLQMRLQELERDFYFYLLNGASSRGFLGVFRLLQLPPFSDIDPARCSAFTLSPLPVLSCAADPLRYSRLFPVRRRRIVSKLCRTLFNAACYTHENLISVLGFCDEDGEKILLYEYVSHGSLDGHLNYSVGLLRPAYTTTFDWSKWRIFWADERVVPNNHVDSNFKLANDLLLAMVIYLFAI
ncbi:hypothetical protein LXL04_011394 [Taraxacum kok-saghyz]